MTRGLKDEKIRRFLADEAMASFVKESLREAFLKPSSETDTAYLASRFLAVELLEQGWKDLAKYQSDNRERAPSPPQPGM